MSTKYDILINIIQMDNTFFMIRFKIVLNENSLKFKYKYHNEKASFRNWV